MKILKQFTATVYILNNDSVLLIYHKKLKKWLPPGGHMESNELPTEAAIREAKEETGLDIELIPQENIWVEKWNGRSFIRPYMCLLEEIPSFGDQPAHQHMDFIYIAKPISTDLIYNEGETDDVRWFTTDALKLLEQDVEIFEETFMVIEHLFNTYTTLQPYRGYVQV